MDKGLWYQSMTSLGKICVFIGVLFFIPSIYGINIRKGLYLGLSVNKFQNKKKYMKIDYFISRPQSVYFFDGNSFKTYRRITGIPDKGETIPDYYDEIKLCGKGKWCQYFIGSKIIITVNGKKTTELYNKFEIHEKYLIGKRFLKNGKARGSAYFIRVTDKKIIKAYLRHVELTHKYSLKDLGFDDKNENKLYQVTAGSGLIVRVKPSARSNHVDWVPANGRVYVIGKTKVKQTIEGKTAYWVKVKLLNGKIGYMFSGFLEKTP